MTATEPSTNAPPVTLRPAGPEDLPEVHRMLIALAAAQGEATTITPDVLERIALQGAAARLLVAHRSDSPQRHPVGYALVILGRNMVAGTKWGVVEQVYVQVPDRGCGIGRALLTAARRAASDAGCAGVTVSSRPETNRAVLDWRAQGLDLTDPETRFAAE
jgi:GNAT superfamily N-acetyltransferase